MEWTSSRLLSLQERKEKGFSIIEALVSIAIITLVLGAFVQAVVLSMEGYQSGQKSTVAAEIAREGMEWIITKRNNNQACLKNASCGAVSDWQEDLVGTWEIDATETYRLTAGQPLVSFVSNHYLCVRSGGRYGYCASDQIPENFTRKVVITAPDAHRILVEAIVEWGSSSSRHQITYSEVLFE